MMWLEASSPLRRKAIEALQVSTGYSPSVIDHAIDNVFKELTREKLLEYVQAEKISFRNASDRTVLHMAAGNVFTSWLHGAVISLLLGYRCWIKPSTQEPVFARLWQQSVQAIDLTLAERIAIVPWNDALLQEATAVVAYGNDETLQTLRDKTPPETLLIGYGHKLSVAIALKEAQSSFSQWSAHALRDCELFDLQGCLSPQIFYVEGSETGSWKSLFQAIGQAPEVRSIASLEAFLKELHPLKDRLSAVGVAGPLARLDPLRLALESLGVTRLCEVGQMQRPPLTWRNGGVSLAEALRALSA
jgi:hypothetical protein